MSKRCLGCMKKYDEAYDICPHCGYIEGTPAKEAYHMEPGTILHNKYIVGRVIGYGGFGVTYIGWDSVLEQVVAIKEYLPSEFATRVPGEEAITVYSGEKTQQFSIGRDKFSDEAKRLAKFNTVEGVVEIKDTFQDNNTSYIVMEYLEGETLKERIEREKKLDVEETLTIVKSILTTLEQVHKGEIIHRDIAPDNIYLCTDGRIKLLDFGASRYATVQHSKSLSVILKEGYAPEEQYRSKGEQGPWSDVYAVGATMYKMLTGVTPEDAMERAENDRLKPVGKYGVKLPKGVETALMNAMNVFAEDRTQSAGEFLKELEAESVERKTITRKKIDLGKWPLWSKILVGCIAVALVVTGVLLSNQKSFALEDGQAYVPEVINMKDEDAIDTVEDYSLTMKIIGQENSDKVDEARVMTQYPDAGRIVNVGELVEVKISAGNTIAMIDVVGMEKDEAQALLETMGFTKIEFKEEESSAPVGTVIKQSIKMGENANVNKRITLTISKGLGEIDPTKEVTVPKFTGMQYSAALDKATNSKLYLVKGSTRASDEPAGTILSQDKKKGSIVKQGTTITVVVSSGNNEVEVPYVMYMSEARAKQILSGYGLKYSVTERKSDTVSAGLVMEQNIEAGRKVEPGTRIKLVVSKGRDNVSVANVTGMTADAAADRLLSQDLRYEVTYSHSESVGWGKVISYSPGGKQEKGTKITINVSTGTAGKLVTASEYNNRYSNANRFSSDKRYRYATRQKEYSYSGSPTKSGWTREGNKIILSTDKSYWSSNNNITPSDQNYGTYGIQKTVAKDTIYTSVAYTCKCKRTYWKSKTSSGTPCESCGGQRIYRLLVNSSNKVSSVFAYDSRGNDGSYCAPGYISTGSPGKFGHIFLIQYNGSGVSSYSSTSPRGYTFLWPSGSFTAYQITTTKYQYKFWRWGAWSGWGDWTTKQSADGVSVKEDSTVMYYVVGKTPQ